MTLWDIVQRCLTARHVALGGDPQPIEMAVYIAEVANDPIGLEDLSIVQTGLAL